MSKICPETIDITCPACAAIDFEVHALTDERLATLKCVACNRDYLLLDSEEYWFDVIQRGYPSLCKCSCGSTLFSLRCNYLYRESGDVRSIDVRTICSACVKDKHLMSMDIRYAGTERLVEQPLTYCKNPKILYDLQELTLYAKHDDIARIVNFLAASCKCLFVGWIRINKEWVKQKLISNEAEEIVRQDDGNLKPNSYLMIYAYRQSLEIPDADVTRIKEENIFWKRNEIIRLSCPTHVGMGGSKALLFYINFANEFVDEQRIVRKSDDFIAMTNSLLHWLKAEFVTWRGPRCFDNPDENIRIFGDRFTRGG